MKVIVFDLDGTAMANKPKAVPSERVIAAVAKAQESFKLCAATGRPNTNAKPILSVLNLKDPCVISAGTQIINPLTDEILWEAAIPPEDAQKVLEVCKSYHYEILIRNELLGEGDKAANRTISEHVNVMYIMGCAQADADVMLEELAKLANITAAGVASWTNEEVDIHVTHKNATKEHAIVELLSLLNARREESIGIGDGDNDVHLFAAVGHKVAMGNATDNLKALADKVIDSVDNDGLAVYLEGLSK